MNSTIKIASRGSRLAKVQVEEILSKLGHLPIPIEKIILKTQGDIDKTTSLTSNPGDDFFTNTLDEALLNGQVDLTIHSAKDLPQHMRDGLEIFALTASIDDTDSWVSSYSLEELPAGAKIGTSSTLRGAMIKKLKPEAQLVDIRGTIEERIALLEAKQIDGLIVATCALKRLGLERHIKSILPWEAVALQGQLAVVGRKGHQQLKKLFEPIDVRRTYGQVYLVGAGPGDPDLITLKGMKILNHADVVFYDYLADPLILKHAPRALHINVGKRKGEHTISQPELSRQLKNQALEGKLVVRLKGGDPLIFGRGADEITYLRSYHINVHVIPGISSAIGIPSSLGVPLTSRDHSSSVAFVSGHGKDDAHPDDIEIPNTQTIVFFMGLTRLSAIVQALLKAGWDKSKPIMIVSNGTKINQVTIHGTLENIEQIAAKSKLSAPALIVAGDTVGFLKNGSNKRYLHCGTHPEQYTHLGEIITWPMIEIKSVTLNSQQQKQLVEHFDQCDFIILTSPWAVEHFMKQILKLLPIHEVLKKIYVLIGRASEDTLNTFGLASKLVTAQETAQGLYTLLEQTVSLKSKNFLFPRSSLPNPYLKNALLDKGALVREWAIYENIKPPKMPLPNDPVDGVIFTSPSTFHNFLKDYGTIPASWAILAKGPVTAKAIEEAGYKTNMVGV